MSKRKSRKKNEAGDSKSFEIVKNLIFCTVPIEHGVTKLLHSVQV